MIRFSNREDIIALTPRWKGERFPDGRPKVADKYLEKMRTMTLEELWKPIFLKGYESQFEGDLRLMGDDDKPLVGRAVTCTFVPTRPDLYDTMKAVGDSEGRAGNFNQWVIDSLVEGDVVVADMYDKIYKGTFIGGNLTTAIKTRTKNGGAVIWGGIRDVQQMREIDGIKVYYRGIDPTPHTRLCHEGLQLRHAHRKSHRTARRYSVRRRGRSAVRALPSRGGSGGRRR